MESNEHFYKIFSAFPRIELKHIRLREFRDDDAERYFHYINHQEVQNFVPVDCVPSSVQASLEDLKYYRSNLARYMGICWAIAHRKTDVIIGSVGLTMMKFIQRKAHINYDLDYEYWGRGLAKEAVSAVIDFADKELKLNRIQANIATTNTRSREFTKSFGFEYEGTMKKFEVLQGKVVDFDIYARVKHN